MPAGRGREFQGRMTGIRALPFWTFFPFSPGIKIAGLQMEPNQGSRRLILSRCTAGNFGSGEAAELGRSIAAMLNLNLTKLTK
jgi:hypothetical protein